MKTEAVSPEAIAAAIRSAANSFKEPISEGCALAIAWHLLNGSTGAVGEVWRPIPDHAGYEASSMGRIRSVTRLESDGRGGQRIRYGKILTEHPARPPRLPYLRVGMQVGGRLVTRSVGRLVCLAFHGRPADGLHAAHLDNDCQNNRPENLAWVSPAENLSHQLIFGTRPLGSQKKLAKLNEDLVRKIRSMARPDFRARKIALALGLGTGAVHGVLVGKTWKHVQ